MNYIYCADISNMAWDQVKSKMNIVSQREQVRITSLRNEKDRCRSLTGKILLLRALMQLGGWKKSSLPELSYTYYKKPYFNGSPGFSITHSGKWVVCAYNTDGDIGIDIEEIRKVNIDEYSSVLTQAEYKWLKSATVQDFFSIWTFKEAVMKADGKGFFLDPCQIDSGRNIYDIVEFALGNKEWLICRPNIDNNYAITMASSNFGIQKIEKVTDFDDYF